MGTITADTTINDFIRRWAASSGAERANFQSFANELCGLIGVTNPDPAHHDAEHNDYTFERAIKFKEADGTEAPGRIDLYKRGAFVMEAKQSREKGRPKAIPNQGDLLIPDATPRGERSATRAWDVLMMNAKTQAEGYARALPTAHGWPPFMLICDVGHCIEVYADFSGQGKNYTQFPDRQGYRVYLEDLRKVEVRARLKAIWDAPHSIDPAKQSAKVTREIAKQLAIVSKALEARNYIAEDVALFLMRCLFTMFAEDVRLLPEGCFTRWLERAIKNKAMFKHELAQLWQSMDTGGYATIAEGNVRRFNGHFYKSATVLDLARSIRPDFRCSENDGDEAVGMA